jgi:hypothetical protein
MPNLLSDIEAFLAKTGMSATSFGDRSTKDRHLVRQMRFGRRVWPETEDKVRTFMREYSPERADAA